MKEDMTMGKDMKLECAVIRDLLLLYEDEDCSEQSRKLVEEHLEVCPACTDYLKQLQRTDEILTSDVDIETAEENKVVRRGFRKIRRRWLASLLVVLMLFPLLGAGLMGYHESKGDGIAFSNLDDIYRCVRFLKCIEHKQFDKAASYIDFTSEDFRDYGYAYVLEEGESESDLRQKLVRRLEEYDRMGVYISNVGYEESRRNNNGSWRVVLNCKENYPDGSSQNVSLYVNGDSMYSESVRTERWTGDILYICNILSMRAEKYSSKYCSYEPDFELPQGKKAEIAWKGSKKKLSKLGIMLVNTSYGTNNHQPILSEDFFKIGLHISVPGEYALIFEGDDNEILRLADLADYAEITFSDIEN